MSHSVLLDCRLFAGGADLSGSSNKIELKAEVEDKEATNYRSEGWKEVLGGLARSEITGEGQWEAGDAGMVDDTAWEALGGRGPWTVCPTDSTVGALAYLTKAMRSSYTFGGQVGDVAPWQGMAKGSWPVARGQIAHPPGTARTATGSGTGVELGAVAAGQRLYAALHVLSVSGTSTPTVTVEIESDVDDQFESAVTQLAFDGATAAGGQILRTDGSAITDTWYRATWTISGTSPSFLFVVALGVK